MNPSDSLADEMSARHTDFVRRFNAGDTDGIAETFYAPDAVILPPHQSPVTGRDAIRAFLRAFFASAERRCSISLTRVEASGDLTDVVGTFTATVRFPDGDSLDDAGNLLEVWRRDDAGSWWCVIDRYASASPP